MQGSIAITVALVTLFASVHYSECTIAGWTTPSLSTKDGSGAITTAIDEHHAVAVTTITLATSTTATGYSITYQPITDKLTIGLTDGVISVASQLDYELTGATYVIVVEGKDADNTGTLTVTLTITDSTTSDPVFTNVYNYVSISDLAAAGTTVATVASSTTSPTYAIVAGGNTDTAFAISTAGVVTVATGKTIDQRNVMGYILTITSVNTNTGTAFLIICVGSNCSSAGSAAINITGSLSMLLAAMLLIKLKMFY